MPNGTYGGVRGRKTKVGEKLLRFPPTRFSCPNLPILHLHPPDHPYDDILMQVFQKL